jgi:hypothetical protein
MTFIYPPVAPASGGASEATLLDVLTQTELINEKLAAAFFTLPYDTLQVVTKTADGPTQIRSRLGGLTGTIVQTLNIVYDIDGDFQSGVVS